MTWQILLHNSLTICLIPTWLVLYILGGQIGTEYKRFILPSVSFLLVLGISYIANTSHWVSLLFLLYIPVLMEGYGEKSWLAKWLKKDLNVRIGYGLMTAIPVCIGALILHQMVGITSMLVIPLLFLPELGSWMKWGHDKKRDILGSDVLRSASIAIYWVYILWL